MCRSPLIEKIGNFYVTGMFTKINLLSILNHNTIKVKTTGKKILCGHAVVPT